MKTFIAGAVVAGAIAAFSFGAAQPARADAFNFSFDPGGVAFAYNDGYWDHDHHWHRWHNAREAREFHREYGERYHAWRHNRDRDLGWHEEYRAGGR